MGHSAIRQVTWGYSGDCYFLISEAGIGSCKRQEQKGTLNQIESPGIWLPTDVNVKKLTIIVAIRSISAIEMKMKTAYRVRCYAKIPKIHTTLDALELLDQ